MNKKLNSFAIFVASVIVSLILVEIGLRAIYYQLNAPYALGIHHLLITRVIPLLRSGAVGLELGRERVTGARVLHPRTTTTARISGTVRHAGTLPA